MYRFSKQRPYCARNKMCVCICFSGYVLGAAGLVCLSTSSRICLSPDSLLVATTTQLQVKQRIHSGNIRGGGGRSGGVGRTSWTSSEYLLVPHSTDLSMDINFRRRTSLTHFASAISKASLGFVLVSFWLPECEYSHKNIVVSYKFSKYRCLWSISLHYIQPKIIIGLSTLILEAVCSLFDPPLEPISWRSVTHSRSLFYLFNQMHIYGDLRSRI